MTNLEVAALLYEIADLMEFRGEESFKARAYRKAAQEVELFPQEIATVAREGRLQQIPGVGRAIADKIGGLFDTGSIRQLEALRAAIPPGVRALTQVPGLGARTAHTLYSRLGIDSLDRLELAARQGQLRDLPGMGVRKEAAILEGLRKLQSRGDRVPIAAVRPIAEALCEALRRHPAVLQADVAGSIRRMQDAVGDIDIVVATQDATAVLEWVLGLTIAGEVIERGPDQVALMTSLGRRVDIRAVAPEQYGLTLLEMTGSAEHLRALADLSRDRVAAPAAAEADLYAALGLLWIPPELREGRGEVEAARAGRLPRLIERVDLKGDLHTHTTASDGTATLHEMAEAARAMGHRFLGVCDHSQSLTIASGLKPDELQAQGEQIRKLNQGYDDFRVLRGSEVDILKDGTLDFPDELLRELDVVVASVHSHFRLDEAAQTERIVQAIKNPHVDVIGHPTGRLIVRREPYDLNVERIIDAAASTGTALEVSASPSRLDLHDRNAALARERGVKLSINTDAHSVPELQVLEYGVGQARRAWLEPGDVINTMDLPELSAWLAREKG